VKNIVIVTAKGANESLADKNVFPVLGSPLVTYPIRAAHEARLVDDVFVSTDDDKIRRAAQAAGARIIPRPSHLARPDTNHGDVIVQASKEAAIMMGELPTTVTILLGNTSMIDGAIIDQSIERTISDSQIDSCMTVWVAQDDHPFRAMVISEQGYLEPFLNSDRPDTNRQSYPKVVFYDQGPWTVRYESLLRSMETKEGPGPWWWMGKHCVPLERPWVTGRDVHTQLDIDIAEWWLNHHSTGASQG
jgi:N-acylneuraminate cytidylyltransferase